MELDRIILIFAGTVILASIALAQFVDPRFIYVAAFIGLNMLQAGFTRWCLMASILKKMGVKPGHAFK
jgi:hypothetical protein